MIFELMLVTKENEIVELADKKEQPILNRLVGQVHAEKFSYLPMCTEADAGVHMTCIIYKSYEPSVTLSCEYPLAGCISRSTMHVLPVSWSASHYYGSVVLFWQK